MKQKILLFGLEIGSKGFVRIRNFVSSRFSVLTNITPGSAKNEFVYVEKLATTFPEGNVSN